MSAAKKRGNKGVLNDVISDRARALNEQIASLEAEIKKLDTQLQRSPGPKLRSTAIPYSGSISRKLEPPPAAKPAGLTEPVFEEIKPVKPADDTVPADRFNELGVRKYDLPALLRKLCDQFKRPTTSNPRLVNYLAAGGVHGLRPLRYEKRVARNRLVLFTLILLVILLGTVLGIFHNMR